MDSYVIYNAEHKVLICREHKTAMPPRFIERHLHSEHIMLSLETRKAITEYAAGLDLVEPAQATIFLEKTAPIPGLAILEGLRCSAPGCTALATSNEVMRKHCKGHAHDAYGPEPARFTKAKLQTFFTAQKNLRY